MWYSSLDIQYQDDYGNVLICGDNTHVLPQMPDESVDLIVTDPPYSLGFMQLAWDKALPSVAVWRECFRVMKPGSFMFVMCIPRMDCQAGMVMNLKEAGFDVSFSPIYHAFAQGFNKSMNMSKKVDQRLGMEREVVGENPNWRDGAKHTGDISWAERDRVHGKAEDRYLSKAASPEAVALDGAYSGFQPKPAVECILVCQKPFTTKHKRSDVYRILGGRYDYWYTQHTEVKAPKEDSKGNIAQLSKKYAKELAQAGYTLKDGDVIERRRALRPDLQDELMVNREVLLWSAPYKDSDITSSITHALDSGKGITWLGECKFPANGERTGANGYWGMSGEKGWNDNDVPYKNDDIVQNTDGARFAANLLVSDNVLDDGTITTSTGGSTVRSKADKVSDWGHGDFHMEGYGDTGGFSRYFSLALWAEEHLPKSVLKTFPFLLVPKPSKPEKNAGLDSLPDKQMYKCDGSGQSLEIFGTTDGGRLPRKNNHPTVKAIQLMAYLIIMGSREGDVVLDPYCGTSTTGVASLLKNRRFVGCEIGKNWCEIGSLRLQWASKEAEAANAQLKLF